MQIQSDNLLLFSTDIVCRHILSGNFPWLKASCVQSLVLRRSYKLYVGIVSLKKNNNKTVFITFFDLSSFIWNMSLINLSTLVSIIILLSVYDNGTARHVSNSDRNRISNERKQHKIFSRCELARELHHQHGIPRNEVATWVCIAKHESNFDTSAVGRQNADGSLDHGIFQISDIYWCSPPGNGRGCGLSCAKLEDADISDDVRCMQRVFNEHQRMTGDGFKAWSVYEPHCKQNAQRFISGCF